MEVILVLGIIVYVVTMLLLISVIRGGIDSSKTAGKLDELFEEVRMLRQEIKEIGRNADHPDGDPSNDWEGADHRD